MALLCHKTAMSCRELNPVFLPLRIFGGCLIWHESKIFCYSLLFLIIRFVSSPFCGVGQALNVSQIFHTIHAALCFSVFFFFCPKTRTEELAKHVQTCLKKRLVFPFPSPLLFYLMLVQRWNTDEVAECLDFWLADSQSVHLSVDHFIHKSHPH